MGVFRTLECICTVDFAEGGSYELMARAIHRRYSDLQPLGAQPPPWSRLDVEMKESNRAQARDITAKLARFGYQIVPLCAWDATDFTFEDDEVEQLAKSEHDRWWQQKIDDGWQWGKVKSDEKKTNPYMVPSEDLPKDVAEWDREFVRTIPAVLASAGLQIMGNSRV